MTIKQIGIELQSNIDASHISDREEIIYLGCSADGEVLITTRFNSSDERGTIGSTSSARSQTKQKLYHLYLEVDNTLILYAAILEKNHQAKILCQIKLKNISDILYITGRRDTLYFLSGREVFQLSIFDAMIGLYS